MSTPNKAAEATSLEDARLRAALKSWTTAPKGTAKLIERALERARASSSRSAGVALGKRRLEIRHTGSGWDIFDKAGEPVPYVARTKKVRTARYRHDETPAQLKVRLSREREQEQRRELEKRIKETREKRAETLAEQRDECRVWGASARKSHKGNARRVATAQVREKCSTLLARGEELFAHKLDDLEAQRPMRRRASTKKSTQGLSRAERQERDSAMRDELERLDRAELIPLWEKVKDAPKFRNLRFDRAQEKFAEYVQETPEDVVAVREVASEFTDDDAACAMALHEAKRGNEGARQFAKENCAPDGRPLRKLSAASRTLSMFDGIAPPPVAALAKHGRAEKAASGPLRGQQTFGTGRFGRSILDTAGAQRGFDDVPF